MKRRTFLKVAAVATVGEILQPKIFAETTQSLETKKIRAEEHPSPELVLSMSQKDGEEQLVAMAGLKNNILKKTAFISVKEGGRWLLVDTVDNTAVLSRGADSGNLADFDITLYRVGKDNIKLPEQPADIDAVSKLTEYLPNTSLFLDAGKDWAKSELLTALYLSYKLKHSTVTGKVATPFGLISYKLNEKADHWAAFQEVYKTADDAVSYFEINHKETFGRDLKALTQRAGADKINVVKGYLHHKIWELEERKRVSQTINGDQLQGEDNQYLVRELKAQYDLVEAVHNKVIIGREKMSDENDNTPGYGEIRDQVGIEIFDIKGKMKEQNISQTLIDFKKAYNMLGVEINFELNPAWEKTKFDK